MAQLSGDNAGEQAMKTTTIHSVLRNMFALALLLAALVGCGGSDEPVDDDTSLELVQPPKPPHCPASGPCR